MIPDATAIAVSCVVPRILFEISRMGKQYFGIEPFIVDSNVKTDPEIKL